MLRQQGGRIMTSTPRDRRAFGVPMSTVACASHSQPALGVVAW
jgi:hypothetical protein